VLSHIRAIDRSDGGALLCGQILADLGADVIQVEPLGGVAPTFGDSTQWVLETLLGYDDHRIAELAIAGALE
jgi:crotonobetainyl-CoA:carnitine CoA-transferase CaiB-like acyl-CoA transferase